MRLTNMRLNPDKQKWLVGAVAKIEEQSAVGQARAEIFKAALKCRDPSEACNILEEVARIFREL